MQVILKKSNIPPKKEYKTSLYQRDYCKAYYLKNRDKINKRCREKFTCVCGALLSRRSKSTHSTSSRHMNFEKEQEEKKIHELKLLAFKTLGKNETQNSNTKDKLSSDFGNICSSLCKRGS